mmetsp:Transcript_16291/g.27675  ORF Transcript_16291/g.27675 Transcript_16291/m.27675 type:complete len:207 (-) Transcript_16291:651-1271(-)
MGAPAKLLTRRNMPILFPVPPTSLTRTYAKFSMQPDEVPITNTKKKKTSASEFLLTRRSPSMMFVSFFSSTDFCFCFFWSITASLFAGRNARMQKYVGIERTACAKNAHSYPFKGRVFPSISRVNSTSVLQALAVQIAVVSALDSDASSMPVSITFPIGVSEGTGADVEGLVGLLAASAGYKLNSDPTNELPAPNPSCPQSLILPN